MTSKSTVESNATALSDTLVEECYVSKPKTKSTPSAIKDEALKLAPKMLALWSHQHSKWRRNVSVKEYLDKARDDFKQKWENPASVSCCFLHLFKLCIYAKSQLGFTSSFVSFAFYLFSCATHTSKQYNVFLCHVIICYMFL